MPGNPYDGHTLEEAIEQAEILSGVRARRRCSSIKGIAARVLRG
jgi:hypothetical protein